MRVLSLWQNGISQDVLAENWSTEWPLKCLKLFNHTGSKWTLQKRWNKKDNCKD